MSVQIALLRCEQLLTTHNLVLQYYGQNPDNSIIVHENQGGAASSDEEADGN